MSPVNLHPHLPQPTPARFAGRTLALAIGVAALGAMNGPGAAAQDGAAPSAQGQIEEIMITARRREENLQVVPVSVTAFSARDIQELGVTDISHLSQMTTNLIIMPNTGDFNNQLKEIATRISK